ncbi:hypothetical protein F4808DRAFT_435791 [Astrocystis sublimbata]|nr:hypothetical protein F4808DRAFT_435791 [Astrocystis sublimbata]
MRFSIITLGLATAVSAAAVPAKSESGCNVMLDPMQAKASSEVITYASVGRWAKSTNNEDSTSEWIDYTGATEAPYSFKYKANTIPGFETNDKIKAVLDKGWVGSYLAGEDQPSGNDYMITAVTCD